MGIGGGRRKDRRQQRDDRPGHLEGGPKAPGGAGWIQMVRRRPSRRLAGVWRRGERRGVLSAPGRKRLDDGQGRIHPLPASGRDHGGDRTDPGDHYRALTREFGESSYDRVEAPATPAEKAALAKLSPEQVNRTELAGDRILQVLTRAPGNNAPIGGLKAVTEKGWFAARPSGTEDIYKIYAESFSGDAHLRRIIEEAQAIVSATLTAAGAPKAGSAAPADADQDESEAVTSWENEGDPN
jgi:hypothetical protein